MTAKAFYGEAWKGMESVGFRRTARAGTIVTQAVEWVVDLGADRIVLRDPRGIEATWQATGGWKISRPAYFDVRLAMAIGESGL